MQNGFLTLDHQRVASVVPALESHHSGGLLGEQVDYLALALVAPLGSQDHHIFTHSPSPGPSG